MKEVLYNDCYGGFGFSALAIKKYLEIVKPELKVYVYKENWGFENILYTRENDIQNNPQAVLTTKDLGDEYVSKNLMCPGEIYLEDYCDGNIRTDKNMIKVVKELGPDADGPYSKLAIAQVEGKYRICEYDGYEWVETPESIEWEE
jgi:hypothetical protein